MPLIEEITESDPAPSHGQSNTASVKIEVVDNPPKQTQNGKYGVNVLSIPQLLQTSMNFQGIGPTFLCKLSSYSSMLDVEHSMIYTGLGAA